MRRMIRFCPVLLSLVLLLAGCGGRPGPMAPFTLTVLDAGKGDALLLTTPAGKHFMVDTGKEEDWPRIRAGLEAKGVTALSGILLTHGHKDHMGNVENLLEHLPVGEICISSIDSITYSGKDREVLSRAPVRYIACGDSLSLDGVRLTVLGPDRADPENENNNSLVLRLEYGSTAMVLMGDAEAALESRLLEQGSLAPAQLIKVGHHGKADATSEALLDAVRPRFAVVTGDPQQDDASPSPALLERLADRGIDTTVTQGDFFACDFVSDGLTITRAPLTPPQADSAVIIDSLDRKAEYIRLRNTAAAEADISGYTILSENGGESYIFPEGTVLPPQGTVTVVSGDARIEGALVWTREKVWKNKKADAALLYDARGALADRMD